MIAIVSVQYAQSDWVQSTYTNNSQEEGIDYDETYALVARLEAIRILLSFSCYKNFTLYQMDVKSAFLNDFISEQVFVKQPPSFEDPKL